VGSVLLPGFGFVDDISLLCTDLKDISECLASRAIFASKYQVDWKPSKDQYLQRSGPSPSTEAFRASSGGSHLSKTIKVLRELFYGRLMRRAATPITTALLEERLRQVQANATGPSFLSVTKDLLELLGLSQFWALSNFPSKSEWKVECKRALHDNDVRLWQEWRAEHGRANGWLHLMSNKWGLQRYTTKMSGKDLALRASLRLGVTSAGASKLHENPSFCRFCSQDKMETGHHLLCDCLAFCAPRARFWTSLGLPKAESSELYWSKYVEFSMASTSFLASVDMLFEEKTKHPLRGSYDTLKPPDDDPEACQESLREMAKWVLSDLDLEEN
jgi:hypothetical protein